MGKWKQYFLLVILVTSYIFGVAVNVQANSEQTEETGAFSLTQFPEDEIILLNKNWEFYWNQLYTPEDLKKNVKHVPDNIELPHNWDHAKLDGKEMSRTGYGTYRLNIRVSDDEVGSTKAIYMPSVASAYQLWINGEKKAHDGKVGKSKEEMKPGNRPQIVLFQVESRSIEIIIQTSNFNQRKAGMTEHVLIGEPKVIMEYREKKLIFRAIIVTSLIVLGVYHFSFFLFRRKEISLLFFGIVCVSIAIRATILEEGLAAYLLAFLNWEITTRLEYLGASLGVVFFTLYTYRQFSEDMSKKIRNLIVTSFTAYSLFIVFASVMSSTRTMLPFQLGAISVFGYLIFIYIKAFLKKREGAFLNAIATTVLFLTIVNDTFFYNAIVDTMELTSVGLFFFLFVQSLLLSRRYANAYSRIERLSNDLKNINESLEQQVQERTAELEQSYKHMQVINQELQDVNQSRSRLFSNISHELGTPLTSVQGYIKGMLDGVVSTEKKYLQLIYEKCVYITRILHDLRSLSDMKTKQIQFDMQLIKIQDYGKELYERYKFDLAKEGISFKYKNLLNDETNELLVSIDPIRIEQVFVNLISNALKYVKKDGEIVVELLRKDNEHVIIKVLDNGSGINEDELKYVFERFYKSRFQENHNKGAGLGLSISKEILEYHNGTLEVESKLGEGTCFFMTLPLAKRPN